MSNHNTYTPVVSGSSILFLSSSFQEIQTAWSSSNPDLIASGSASGVISGNGSLHLTYLSSSVASHSFYGTSSAVAGTQIYYTESGTNSHGIPIGSNSIFSSSAEETSNVTASWDPYSGSVAMAIDLDDDGNLKIFSTQSAGAVSNKVAFYVSSSGKVGIGTETPTEDFEVATSAKIKDPTFTGTVSGVTKAHVGLGSVDNDSTSTIRSGTTKANVGLGNVDNTSDNTIRSGNFTGTINGVAVDEITTVHTRASQSTTTFFQDAIPTSLATNDQWIDTNDSMKLYVAGEPGVNSIGSGGWRLASPNKTTVGLGNVDNDSTSTIRSGTTAANVGLGNVTNESKATMFTDATFTGGLTAPNITGSLAGNVKGNVDGNSATTTKLAAAKNIGGVAFDGSGNIDLPGVNARGDQDTTGTAAVGTSTTVIADNENADHYLTYVDSATGTQQLRTDTDLKYNPAKNNLLVESLNGISIKYEAGKRGGGTITFSVGTEKVVLTLA